MDEAYHAAEGARLGPAGRNDDIMGPDGYRTALLFQASMPELPNDRRFARLCARLGLVEFWLASSLWHDCADEVPYDFRRECERVRGRGEGGVRVLTSGSHRVSSTAALGTSS